MVDAAALGALASCTTPGRSWRCGVIAAYNMLLQRASWGAATYEIHQLQRQHFERISKGVRHIAGRQAAYVPPAPVSWYVRREREPSLLVRTKHAKSSTRSYCNTSSSSRRTSISGAEVTPSLRRTARCLHYRLVYRVEKQSLLSNLRKKKRIRNNSNAKQ